MRAVGKVCKSTVRSFYFRARDVIHNRRCSAERRFLVVRHGAKNPRFYDILLDWLAENFADIRARFELRLLPCRLRDTAGYVLHVPWLQDPVQHWSRRAYAQANRLAAKCDENQIPIINRVDRLANAAKSTGAHLIATTALPTAAGGLRTPRTLRIKDRGKFPGDLGAMRLPVLIREDWGHGGPVYRVDTPCELRDIPLDKISRPVAIEYIDARSQHDGLYRKYRLVVAGDETIPHHLQISRGWLAKGQYRLSTEATRREELAYISRPCPHEEEFQRASRALGFDFVAFDYSYDQNGQPVVWEANPYPYIHFPNGHIHYIKPAVERTLAAITKLYLGRSGLPVPERLQHHLSYGRCAGR